jgi:predicted DNA-binding transcriptional regulator AlpA
MSINLITRIEAQNIAGIFAESTWFKFVKAKLQPSGINISVNTVRYIKSEVETIKIARVAGYSDIQIKALVTELEKKRLLSAQEFLYKNDLSN